MSEDVRKRDLLHTTRGITIIQTLVLTATTVGIIAVTIALRDAVKDKTCAEAAAISGIGTGGGGGGCGGETSVARVMPAPEDRPSTPPGGGDPAGGGGDHQPVAGPGGDTPGGGTAPGGDTSALGTVTQGSTPGVLHFSGGPWEGGMQYVPGSDYASPMPGTFPEGTYQRLNVKTGQVEEFTEGLLGYSAPQFDFTGGWLTPGYNDVDGAQNDGWIIDPSTVPRPDPNQEVWQEWRWSLWANEPGDIPIYQEGHVAGVLQGTGVAPIVGLVDKGLGLFGGDWQWGERFNTQTDALADQDTEQLTTIIGLAADVFSLGGTGVRHIDKIDDVVDVVEGVVKAVDDVVPPGTGALLTTVRQSDNVYPLLHGETGRVVGQIRGDTPIFRIEPRNVDTPLQPHDSPFFEPGRIHAGPDGDALFIADSRQALADLERLRTEQGYFDAEDLVLRSTTYDDFIAAFPDARIMTDAKMEFGRGIEGARVVVVPRGSTPVRELPFQEFDPAEIGRVIDELPDTHAIRLDPDVLEGINDLGVGESVTIPHGEFSTEGVVDFLKDKGGHTVYIDSVGDMHVVNGAAELPANGRLILSDTRQFSGRINAGNLIDTSEASGHMISGHIGVDEATMQARLDARRKIQAVSSFTDRAEAEAALSSVIDAEGARFDAWVAGGYQGHLTVQAPFAGGTVLPRGGVATPGTHARFVLQGDGQGGFYILTGFPTAPVM